MREKKEGFKKWGKNFITGSQLQAQRSKKMRTQSAKVKEKMHEDSNRPESVSRTNDKRKRLRSCSWPESVSIETSKRSTQPGMVIASQELTQLEPPILTQESTMTSNTKLHSFL
ncbi:conserved hypothetical protein [Ricinus communis]|uniref:Uncharacterized protein n=1 Tax=Ricinus communis TaxID=3988 RepID=B9SEK4_RICCO|nr:conserved hypothetical protein [Ricinus communis]